MQANKCINRLFYLSLCLTSHLNSTLFGRPSRVCGCVAKVVGLSEEINGLLSGSDLNVSPCGDAKYAFTREFEIYLCVLERADQYVPDI